MLKLAGGRFYYGWVVVAVVFLALPVSAGVRAAPAVLINPLESELGWGRAAISFAVSIGLLLYGLSGPVAGWLMDRFGPTRLTLSGLALIGGSTLAGAAMTELWQLNLFWGVSSGIGTGIIAPVSGHDRLRGSPCLRRSRRLGGRSFSSSRRVETSSPPR